MSAYLLETQTIGLLAQYAIEGDCTQYGSCYGLDLGTTDKVAEVLAKANLYSVAYRYSDIADNPAKAFQATESRLYIKDCQNEAKRLWNIPPIEIIKSCHCFAYQSCEPDNWHQSTAYKIITEIEGSAVRKLAGYDSAQWGYTTDNLPPIVRNMSDLPDNYSPGAGEVISLFS